MTESPKSEQIAALYTKGVDDEAVYELTDANMAGIHVIRQYKHGTVPHGQDRRMFIKFYVRQGNFVHGGVDMVQPRSEEFGGYPLVYEDQKGIRDLFKPRYPGFLFGSEEAALFDLDKVIFRGHTFTINEFIDQVIVKNHLVYFDMFWFSRLAVYTKNFFILEPLFWFGGGNY